MGRVTAMKLSHPHSRTSPGLSSAEVCELAGVTYRQLDYWLRCGLFPDLPASRGSGSRRVWGPHHAAVAALWACLHRLGADTSTCLPLAWWAAELEGPWDGLLVVSPSPSATVTAAAQPSQLEQGAGWVIDLAWCWSRAAETELGLMSMA